MPESGQVNEVVPPAPPPLPLEERKPDWATKVFTSVVLLALLLLIVLVLIGATVPMMVMDGGGGDSRSSEARAALGAMKDRARVYYQRTGKAPKMADLDLGPNELNGSYFSYANYSCGGDSKHWWARCTGVYSAPPTDLIFDADLVSGSATFNR